MDSFQNFDYISKLCAFKEFCVETRLSNIFKTTNVTNSTKVIQQSSYSVLQVTSKWKTLKQLACFLKVVEFDLLFTFKLTLLWLYFGKSCKTTFFRKPTEVSQNTLTFISIGCPLRNNSSLKI